MSKDAQNPTSDDSSGELIENIGTSTSTSTTAKEARDSVYHDSQQEDEPQGNEDDDDHEDSEEDEAAYRLRVYGTTEQHGDDAIRGGGGGGRPNNINGSLHKQLSKRFSRHLQRQRSSIIESLPETTAGWTVLLSALLTAGLGYEIQLQKSLTKPPITFGQLPKGSDMASIYHKMTATPKSILSRPIQPSLFVGTRGALSSTAAFLLGGPSTTQEHLRFREIVRSSIDGAQVGVDWEVPWKTDDVTISTMSAEERRGEILKGAVRQPVVIILHGINNDTSFGYIKSLARTFANRGWNAAAMNFRGCGGVPLATPRGYNGSYTGDLRNLVLQISGRLAENVPVFLVGNSLGANILTKYLGEEGLSGTLPKCVSGAASLGNPLFINSELTSFPFNIILAMGVKESLFHNWTSFNKMKDPLSRRALRKGLTSLTIAGLDRAVAPVLIRNDAFYPFAMRLGFKSGEAYWMDCSSYRLIRYISIPLLNLTAKDDFLVGPPSKNKLGFCIANPNVMVVETRCGGHLGWQESPPDSDSTLFGASSWADIASADFFDSIMQTNRERTGSPVGTHKVPDVDHGESAELSGLNSDFYRLMKQSATTVPEKLQSRL